MMPWFQERARAEGLREVAVRKGKVENDVMALYLRKKYELFKSDIGESYHGTSMCSFNIWSYTVQGQSTLYSYS